MTDWRWLSEAGVLAMHGELIAQHGGEAGLRDEGLLSSALMRPQHQALYGTPSVFDLAAAYAFGLVRDHPFVDGNKRIGFLASYVFLSLNGHKLKAPEAEAVAAILALARGDLDEAALSAWLATAAG